MRPYNIITALVLQYLNCNYYTYVQRTLTQKKIYLAQQFGIPLSFGFVWSFSGPFSEDLDDVVRDIFTEGFGDIEKYSIKKNYLEILDKINDLENTIPKSISIAGWFQLLAGIKYFMNRSETDEEVIIKIKNVMLWTNEEEIKIGLKELKNI